jgi:hypothetical protein
MAYDKYFKADGGMPGTYSGGMCGSKYAGGEGVLTQGVSGGAYAGGCGNYSGGATLKERMKRGVAAVRTASRKKNVRMIALAISVPIVLYILLILIKPKMVLVSGSDKLDQKKVMNTVLLFTLVLWGVIAAIYLII